MWLNLKIILRTDNRGERGAAERFLETFMKFFLMVALPFAVGTLMFGTPVVTLLTTPEIGAAGRWVPPLVAVGSIFYGIVLLMDPVALALGRNRASLAGYAALALNLILLPLFRNVHVAAMTTLVGYVVCCLWMWNLLRADWRLSVDKLALLRYPASVIMGLVLFVLGYDPTGGRPVDILPLVGGIIIGVVVYFAALGALGGVGRAELTEINSLLNFRAVRGTPGWRPE